jgi:putative DNA primase/helicase
VSNVFQINGDLNSTMRAAAEANRRQPDDDDSPSQAERTRALYIDTFTENEVAKVFATWYNKDLRYDHNIGQWFRWNGNTWQEDQTQIAFHFARRLSDNIVSANNASGNQISEKIANAMGRASFASAVDRFARADRAFAITAAVWDKDLYLLGTPGGVVNLKTGELLSAQREQFISKQTGVIPAARADCPQWDRFMMEITGQDAELVRFHQQFFGYGLTGDVREHAMMFGYGAGGNGKGVENNIIRRLMGSYATTAPISMLIASNWDRHPTELAMLRGARLVSVSETEDGQEWKEVLFKQLTGGDPIPARFMRQDFFTYMPQFKLVIFSNFKPRVRNIGDAMARRINMVPFLFKPAVADHDLEERLFSQEGPQILRWLINGCLDWQRNGLIRPAVVVEATKAYFEDNDHVRQWAHDRCDLRPAYTASSTALWNSWKEYANENGEKCYTQEWFKNQLERLGCKYNKNARLASGGVGRGFEGIRIKN